jgi:hypothetical protein
MLVVTSLNLIITYIQTVERQINKDSVQSLAVLKYEEIFFLCLTQFGPALTNRDFQTYGSADLQLKALP